MTRHSSAAAALAIGMAAFATAIAGAQADDSPIVRPPPRHEKYKHSIVGADGYTAVVTVCVDSKRKFKDAHLSMSTGDDAADDRAVAYATRTTMADERYAMIVIDGKPVATCFERRLDMRIIDRPPGDAGRIVSG